MKIAIREIHDTIKQHPYWNNFDPIYNNDIYDLFKKMGEMLWEIRYDVGENKNPYYVVLKRMYHDFNAFLYWFKCGAIKNNEQITYFQIVLQLFHRMIDFKLGDSIEERVFGYFPQLSKEDGHVIYSKCIAVKVGNIYIIKGYLWTNEQLQNTIKFYESYTSKHKNYPSYEKMIKELEELKTGKTETNSYIIELEKKRG